MTFDMHKTIPGHTFDEVLADLVWKRAAETMVLPVPIGWDEQSELKLIDLAKVGHLLLAGASGQGKSVFLHNAICSLASCRSLEQVQFGLIDFKRIELDVYRERLAHRFGEVASWDDEAFEVVTEVVKCLADRAAVLNRGIREQFNALPHIVVVVDEFADVILGARGWAWRKLLDGFIEKCASLKVHFIFATQEFDNDVLYDELLEAIPSRVVFKVKSASDSRMILGTDGAEKLIGAGDLLLSSDGNPPIHLRGSWISDGRVAEVASL